MTEQNEQEVTDIPEMNEDLKNSPDALYQLLGAVVNQHPHGRIQVPAADTKLQYNLRIDQGENGTLIVANKVVEKWAE
ncbi:hypothetical protein [Arthrobacter sp. BE255]|uniref:hypothetical protein n=1 Tax=Arthrobacter sp. BE255 TaxID=2817721 RepID=UPI0028553884|nr:hypothetical protein [Arthrobacter sp. BE255]MDR7161392.1 hypothetical protein [Arthrobacter sp. BE255]